MAIEEETPVLESALDRFRRRDTLRRKVAVQNTRIRAP